MDRWAGKVVLVTGASDGIGAEIAKTLAEKGMKVIAVARRLDKLKELAACVKRDFGTDIYPMACDVRKEEDILKVFEWANDKLGGVDALINNAGVILNEPIIESSTETFRAIMEVNVIAMAICSREFTRSVKKRKTYGHIININSITGHNAESVVVAVSLYPASKYAVTGMTYSLRNEIMNAQLDIKVTSLSPGLVDTDMFRSLNLSQDTLDKIDCLRAKDIANGVVYVLSTPPNVVINELIISSQSYLMSEIK